MARPSWLVDSNRIATKIRSASSLSDHEQWKSNPTRSCPNCHHIIDNSDVAQEWPGLPRGVKFDPSDQEIIWHLRAKAGVDGLKPHPFIDEFIPTVEEDDGICYTHPQNLPGVKQDGSVAHFFHQAIKAYNTGNRKRRKILGDDFGDVRWHKTGRTKPVMVDGVQKGCKKIMVLYISLFRGGKSEKTNWVMHQYHLGTTEDEKDGEYVISKIFYQQQQLKQSEKSEHEVVEPLSAAIIKVDPVTPKSITPDPPRAERQASEFGLVAETAEGNAAPQPEHAEMEGGRDMLQPEMEHLDEHNQPVTENNAEMQGGCDMLQPEMEHLDEHNQPVTENDAKQMADDHEQHNEEDPKWWDSESQYILDSQQLVEGLSLCDELLQSQSPNRNGNTNDASENKPRLSDYAQLGPEDLKKDLEECQNVVFDPANIDLDTPPDFRLSQLDFGSQESFVAWGGKVND